jgi:hypothetical protein
VFQVLETTSCRNARKCPKWSDPAQAGATCTRLLFYSSNVIYIDYYYLRLALNQTTMLQVHIIGLLPSY